MKPNARDKKAAAIAKTLKPLNDDERLGALMAAVMAITIEKHAPIINAVLAGLSDFPYFIAKNSEEGGCETP